MGLPSFRRQPRSRRKVSTNLDSPDLPSSIRRAGYVHTEVLRHIDERSRRSRDFDVHLRSVSLHLRVFFVSIAWLQAVAHESGKDAIAQTTAQILQHPEKADSYIRRASLYLETGDWKACLADLESAERLRRSGLHRLRAEALLMGNHEGHAIALLKGQEDADSLWIKARAEASMGNPGVAAKDCHQALSKLSKPEPDLYLQCADFYFRDGQEIKALSVLDEGPELPVIVQKAISLEVRLGRIDKALSRLEKLIASSSVKEPLLAQKASLLAQAGRTNDSLKCWEDLVHRITSMTPQAQGSQAMSLLLIQSNQAIKALRSIVGDKHP